MPMPYNYRHASAEWRQFLDIAKDEMALDSDNSTFTAIEGVMHCFRNRLTLDQALRFADLLPAVPCEIFVANWHPCPPVPWGGRADQITEAKALRPHHNLTPANCIEATAIALRATVPAPDFDHLLAAIGTGAQDFWRVPPAKLRTVTFPG